MAVSWRCSSSSRRDHNGGEFPRLLRFHGGLGGEACRLARVMPGLTAQYRATPATQRVGHTLVTDLKGSKPAEAYQPRPFFELSEYGDPRESVFSHQTSFSARLVHSCLREIVRGSCFWPPACPVVET